MQNWLPDISGVSFANLLDSGEVCIDYLSDSLNSFVFPWVPASVFTFFWLFVELVTSSWNSVADNFGSLVKSFSFDEFQVKLLQSLLLVLICNIVLTLLAWRVYGKKITERFMQTSSDVLKEELKTAVSDLKLPNEHSPRL